MKITTNYMRKKIKHMIAVRNQFRFEFFDQMMKKVLIAQAVMNNESYFLLLHYSDDLLHDDCPVCLHVFFWLFTFNRKKCRLK